MKYMVGCFPSQRKRSPLKKAPETPETVNTKFWLYTKSNIAEPQLLVYGDNLTSILLSDFNPKQPVKVLIHGFKGSASEKGALTGKNAILKLGDYNVVVLDWKRGAAAAYPVAVANTELVGRQTALLLLDMIAVGAKPSNIHLVGFSLGAHIAGCAGFVVQQYGHKLGRITGLDPASPIFRHHIILDTSRKLDPSDADFVDVIHTDGSPVWTNGFGLLRQIGHVDFFPNGGREQPGCHDRRASVVVSHFEGVLDIDIACSHARAWFLFLESLVLQKEGCQFMAYPCLEGLQAFTGGMCFPSHGYCNRTHKDQYHSCGLMGENADVSPGRGALYLVTRESPPFCGEQLRATAYLSEKTHRTKGILHIHLDHGSSTTKFHIKCEFLETIEGGQKVRGLGAAEYGSIDPYKTPTIKAFLSYQTTVKEEMVSPTLYVNHLEIMDQKGNRWRYCGKEEILEDNATTPKQVPMVLKYNTCTT